jgi:gamma-glutamyl:cysteine ligase YbdK (ATP-grasp superfamily)
MGLVKTADEILRTVPGHLRTTPTPAPHLVTEPPAEPAAKPEIEVLLERGEASTTVATRRCAGRLRTTIAELRERLKAEAEQEQVVARIAELRKQLDDTEAKLRRLRSVKTVQPGRPTGVDTRKVRAWAIDNNIRCARAGMLPATVLAAYRAAHGGTS